MLEGFDLSNHILMTGSVPERRRSTQDNIQSADSLLPERLERFEASASVCGDAINAFAMNQTPFHDHSFDQSRLSREGTRPRKRLLLSNLLLSERPVVEILGAPKHSAARRVV